MWCFSYEEHKVFFKGMISHRCNDLKQYEGDGEGEAEGESWMKWQVVVHAVVWNDSTRVSWLPIDSVLLTFYLVSSRPWAYQGNNVYGSVSLPFLCQPYL